VHEMEVTSLTKKFMNYKPIVKTDAGRPKTTDRSIIDTSD